MHTHAHTEGTFKKSRLLLAAVVCVWLCMIMETPTTAGTKTKVVWITLSSVYMSERGQKLPNEMKWMKLYSDVLLKVQRSVWALSRGQQKSPLPTFTLLPNSLFFFVLFLKHPDPSWHWGWCDAIAARYPDKFLKLIPKWISKKVNDDICKHQ